mgnify:CR=1 FL=1
MPGFAAALRGVDVRVMLPGVSDNLATKLAAELDRLDWLREDTAERLADDIAGPARAFVEREDGWWAQIVAAVVSDRGSAAADRLEALDREVRKQRDAVATARAKVKQQRLEAAAQLSSLRDEVKTLRRRAEAMMLLSPPAWADALALLDQVLAEHPDAYRLRADKAYVLTQLEGLLAKGDDAMLRGFGSIFEERGLRLISPAAVLGEAMTLRPGPLGRHAPAEADLADAARAAAIVTSLGPHDVGQWAVVARGLVLAVEAIEGTPIEERTYR